MHLVNAIYFVDLKKFFLCLETNVKSCNFNKMTIKNDNECDICERK